MNKLHTAAFNQKGIVHIFLLLVLLIGLAAGLYLVQTKTNLFSRAFISQPVGPEVSITVDTILGEHTEVVGGLMAAPIIVHSDFDYANLFVAKLTYDPTMLKFESIQTTGTIITSWVEQHGAVGDANISLVGGVPNPGIRTQVGSKPLLATILFTPIKTGTTRIQIQDTSGIYRNSDNVNILATRDTRDITIGNMPPLATPTPNPSASPSPTPTPTPPTTAQNWNYQRDYSGTQGQNNLNYLAYIKSSGSYAQASFDGTNWKYTGGNSDRNFLIESSKIAPSGKSHSVIRWTAPKSGNINVTGYFRRCCAEVGDFKIHPLAIYSVRKNTDTKLWEQTVEGPINYDYNLTSSVSTGDTIEFWVDADNDSGWDGTWMDFTINYGTSASQAAINTSNLGLTDLSGLLSDFNKTNGFKPTSDLNLDKVVNTPDFSLMRNALIQNGVVKGN